MFDMGTCTWDMEDGLFLPGNGKFPLEWNKLEIGMQHKPSLDAPVEN